MKKTILLILMFVLMAFPCWATVTNSSNKIIYQGDNITSTFSFPFNVYKTTDLTLTEVDPSTYISTTLTINTDYTVSLSHAAPTTGSITLTAGALATGTELVIQRVLPFTQQINISDYSPTPAATWNEGYDRGVMLSQQLQEQVSRAIVQSVTQSSQITFPVPVEGECVGWASGQLTNMTCSGGGGGSGFNPPIPDSQLQQIVTTNKVKGTALSNLNLISAGAGTIPIANIPSISDNKLLQITTAGKVDAAALVDLGGIPVSAGVFPSANVPSPSRMLSAPVDMASGISYHADTDTFVLASGTGSACEMKVVWDVVNPPTAYYLRQYTNSTDQVVSVTVPVPKGYYFKIVTGCTKDRYYWVSSGS